MLDKINSFVKKPANGGTPAIEKIVQTQILPKNPLPS